MSRDPGMDRLADAIAAWVRFRSTSADGSRAEFLAGHEDLRDLLEPMLAEDAAAAAAPGIGEGTVLGDFRLLREIGRGGMGIVYEAQQLSLDRRVALKLLPPGASLHPRTLARFRREATTAARFEHAGIVAVHAVGEHQGLHWFAMELVRGQPLDRFAAGLRAAEPADWLRRVIDLCAQVADALQYAHEQGVVHRDVKPGNVLVRPDDTAVVTDFGLARSAGLPSLTQAGEFAGTPNYVSPEQARGDEEVDARSDVFSLGVTLYELLTRELPFSGDSVRGVLDRILRAEARPPSRVAKELPRDLDAVVLKALAKDPRHRYQSAAAFGDDLRRFLAHRPVLARPVRAPQRLWRWVRRRPVEAALTAAVVAATGLGIYVLSTKGAVLRGNEQLVAEALEERMLAATIAPHTVGGASREQLIAELRSMAPDEPLVAVVLALSRGDEKARLAQLDEFTAAHGAVPAIARLRAHWAGSTDPLPPPGDALDHFVAGEIAMIRWAAGEHEAGAEAMRHMQRAVAMSPRPRSQFLIGLNRAGRAVGDMDAVRTAADALVRLWPQSAASHCHRAMAWVGADNGLARAEAQRSLELEHDNFLGLLVLSQVAEHEGDAGKAAELMETARRLHPRQASFMGGSAHGEGPPQGREAGK